MKTLPFFLLVAAVVTSCSQSGSQANKNTDSLKTDVTSGSSDGCFLKTNGKDSVSLQLHIRDTSISGDLSYRYFEKDKNTGTISGNIRNNIIHAQYAFMSEGVQSTRPVVFKLQDDKIYEAVPDSINPEGIPVFTNNDAALKFDVEPLSKISCKE
ncbi:hypothetical protein HF329_02200 [Chitinophaga oryzae]|uniref:Uncharacterized protein n=1 Tax=Chitinophaga oryzae TaxID=2725414 RepID=A0AAE6ZC03_9BACT|nr:hypothetical protein [Chitinophaga oryzae]QJB30183.1 hypothetical protein HF329_02200 [Chitinophaga oryzae]